MSVKKNTDSLIAELYQIEHYIHYWRDSGSVPKIERDLVLHKLQQLYEQIHQLNATSPSPEEKPAPTAAPVVSEKVIIATEPVPQEIKKEEEKLNEEQLVITESPGEPVEAKPIPEEVPEIKREVLPEEKPSAPAKEILADKLAAKQTVLNENIAKSRDIQDYSSKLKNAPIASIQSAINLNDKFLFIRELFKNNNLLYNQTIERLNQAASFDDAVKIIEQEFAWDINDPLVLKLIDLIKRRHNA